MKKMFRTKLAFLLVAAALLTGGTFTSCSDGGESSGGDSAVEALPAPSGKDPFKSGCYRLNDEWWEFFFGFIDDDDYSVGLFNADSDDSIKFDTRTRTIEILNKDKNVYWDSLQFRYTYNETDKTVTLALSKVAIQTDPYKLIDSIINGNDYDGGYKLGSLSEYKKTADTIYNNEDYQKWWTIDQGSLEDLAAHAKRYKARYEKAFSTPLVYSYTINEDESIALDLTSPEPIYEFQSTTLQFVVE